jgi:hypothetical protein
VITRIAVLAGACVLLLIVLIAAATGAVVGVLAAPLEDAGKALDGQVSAQQLDAAQFCALGKITPGRATGYGTYTTAQIANATTIYQVAVSLGLPQYAAVVAIATALQESDLYNLDYGDRDSLGLFQQRPSQGWGTPAEITTPTYAATKFYEALVKVPDWQTIPLTEAAQAVQRSAYPDAYAAHTTPAEYLVATVSGALESCPVLQQRFARLCAVTWRVHVRWAWYERAYF